MRRIAVVSDTHDKLPDYVVDAVSGVDEIWHLGDVCAPVILDPLIALGRPLVVVQGNCDSSWDWRLTRRVEHSGTLFHLEHIPPTRPPEGVHVVLHGHTHVPRDEVIRGVRYLNPGCITRPNRGAPSSLGWLTVAANGAIDWRLVRLAELA
ncbi:MAG TPA: metallophosphoesterase family protein [Opitutaceae bacterium]